MPIVLLNSNIQIMHLGQFALFFVTMYIALDTAFGFTSTFGSVSSPPDSIRSIPLFVLTSIWPGACVPTPHFSLNQEPTASFFDFIIEPH